MQSKSSPSFPTQRHGACCSPSLVKSTLHPKRTARGTSRRHQAGFTLLEMMIVVVTVGVLAAMGLPSIAARMRDRRANQAAHEISLLYRRARAMAMGRGGAVLVRFDSSGQGSVELREALNGTTNA